MLDSMSSSESELSNRPKECMSVKILVASRGTFELHLSLDSSLEDLIRMAENILAIDSRRFSLIFQENEISNGPMNIIEYGLYEGCLVHMIAKTNTGQDRKREYVDIQMEKKLFEFMELMKLSDPEKYQSMIYEYMAMHAGHIVIGHDTETDRTTLSIKSPDDDRRSSLGITFTEEDNPDAVPKRLDTRAWKLVPIMEHFSPSEEENTERLIADTTHPIAIKFDMELPNLTTPSPIESHEVPTITLEQTQSNSDQCFCCKKKLRLTNRFTCRCGLSLCSIHRYSDRHDCDYNFTTEHRALLSKQNPRICLGKIDLL
jgi:hypothetical protein